MLIKAEPEEWVATARTGLLVGDEPVCLLVLIMMAAPASPDASPQTESLQCGALGATAPIGPRLRQAGEGLNAIRTHGGDTRDGKETNMSEHARHTAEDIAFAAEGIRHCPGGVDADALVEGALFLGAIALDLEKSVPSAAHKVAANQDRIAYYRGRGMTFAELSVLTANVVLASLWLEEFFGGACPDVDVSNAKPLFLDSMAELEELSSSRHVPAAFAVHAFLETPPPERQRLLTALAAQT